MFILLRSLNPLLFDTHVSRRLASFFSLSAFGYCKMIPGLLLKYKNQPGGNMRGFSFLFIGLILIFSGVSAFAQSRTGYVTDMLILTFRQGPGPSYEVMKTLESNTRLTILEEQNGYYRVRLSSGETGWVDKQFVTFDTPKTEIIEKMKAEYAALKNRFTALSAAHDQLKDKIAAMSENSDDLFQIIQKNKALEKENKDLSLRIEALEKESETLFKAGMIKWFLAGFGVIVFGWILGRTVSVGSRRRSSLLS
jgi:SH3 domain protein